MLGRATGNTDTQALPRPGLGGNHHLPLYSILCTSPLGPHPNDFLFRNSQMGVPKSPKLGLSRFWSPITLRADLVLRCSLKQSCSPCWDLFNGMSHAVCKQVNQVNSWLFLVGSQIVILKSIPLELGTTTFPWTLASWWFVASRPRFWWWIWNHLWRLLWD